MPWLRAPGQIVSHRGDQSVTVVPRASLTFGRILCEDARRACTA
jgi:hypothetical protein